MCAIQVNENGDPSLSRILKQLCRALNPVRVLRRMRISARHSPNGTNLSGSRQALQSSIEVLNVAFSIAETIPVVGIPLKGALEALYKILGDIERRFQNTEASAKLAERLASLVGRLSLVQAPDSLLMSLIGRLIALKNELESLLYSPGIRFSVIAQALVESTSQIDSYLIDYLVELLAWVRVADTERINRQCVTVLDPFGLEQLIPRVDIGNANVVAAVILSRYSRNPKWHKALDEFVSGGLYELTMDDGLKIQPLTGALVPPVSQGGTVVMSVVVLQVIEDRGELRCPTCKRPMPISEGDDRDVCTGCDRRVSAVKAKGPSPRAGKQVQRSNSIDSSFLHITIRHSSTARVQEISEAEGEAAVTERVKGEGAVLVTEETPPALPGMKNRPALTPESNQQNPIVDFGALENQYLNMLAGASTTESNVSGVEQTAVGPGPGPLVGTQTTYQGLEELTNNLASPEFRDNPNLGDQFDMDQFLTTPPFLTTPLLHDFDGPPEGTPYYTAPPEFKDNPNLGDQFDMNQFLHSPLPDLLHDFDGSHDGTPYFEFLTTPIIDDEILPSDSDYDMSMPIFPDMEPIAAPTPFPIPRVEDTLPHIPMDQLFIDLPLTTPL